jgi:transcriptional regulator with XRE-family HTH domain
LPCYHRSIRIERTSANAFNLRTIGNHIRRRRLELGWLQKEVAEAVGADTATVFGWEVLGRMPAVRFLPAIIKFLGYNPLPLEEAFSKQIRRARLTLGLSQQQLAKKVGVDESTVADCEADRRLLHSGTASRLAAVLSLVPSWELEDPR